MLLLSIKGISNAKNLLQLVSWVPGTTKIDPEKANVSSKDRHRTHSECARRVEISPKPLYHGDAGSYRL